MSEVRLLTSYFLPLTSHPSPLYYHRMTFVFYLFIEVPVCVCVCVCVTAPTVTAFFIFVFSFSFFYCVLFSLICIYFIIHILFCQYIFVKNQKYRGNLASCQKSPVPMAYFLNSIPLFSKSAMIFSIIIFISSS